MFSFYVCLKSLIFVFLRFRFHLGPDLLLPGVWKGKVRRSETSNKIVKEVERKVIVEKHGLAEGEL